MGGRASYIVHRYSWGHDMYMYGCLKLTKISDVLKEG